MKLKIGMEVRAVSDQEGYVINGMKGKIVEKWHGDLEFWGVEFDKRFVGSHSLGGILPNGKGLWVEDKFLVPINFRLENK